MAVNELSPMLQRLRPPATVAMTEKARLRKIEDPEVLVISGGEPDFDTPDFIKDAAIAAIRAGHTKYTPTSGTPNLKLAIAAKFKRENGLDYAPEEIVVSTGGKQVIFDALMCTLRPGQDIVLPRPSWVSYADIAELAGASVTSVPCSRDNGYKITPAELKAAITPNTRWFVINSPCNPTGAVYSAAELRGLADVLLQHPDILILCDDIYEHLVYGDTKFATIAAVEPKLRDRTVTVNGVSKTYCMTGWRIGYAGAPKWLVQAMTKLQAQTTTSNCSVSEAAAVAALNGSTDFVAVHNEAYKRRRDFLVKAINANPLLSCDTPEGAFYIYVDVSRLIGLKVLGKKPIENDLDVADFFLDEAKIAVVPGVGFGFSPYVRFCFAYSDEIMREVASRVGKALQKLVPAASQPAA